MKTTKTCGEATLKTSPHFLILGTQKGGTNSLYHYLCQHPQIIPATQKEIHFFSLNYYKGLDWYKSQFSPAADGKLLFTGEGSPYYLYHPCVPQRVHQNFPNMKLIVLLRNPVERAISHYYWEVKLGHENLSFEEAIFQEKNRLAGEVEKLLSDEAYYSFNHQHYSYLSRGIYVEQLIRWLHWFPAEQFLFLKSEDLYEKSTEVVNQVFDFLGLPRYYLSDYYQYNANDYPAISSELYQKVFDDFKLHNKRLASLIKQDFDWNAQASGSQKRRLSEKGSISESKLQILTSKILEKKHIKVMNNPKIDYEGAWNEYAQNWQSTNPDYTHVGDEWIGFAAGAAQSLSEYETLIEQNFIAPYIKSNHTVLEIGIGGGKTAALLLKYCERLICADISDQMLKATRDRLGEERVSYVKLDGLTLEGVSAGSIDVCFCYDTMVHIEPRDIFNYLTQIPQLLRGDRLCVFHHTNTLSELGWQKFLKDWDKNLLGRRHGTAFSVMTDAIMEKFLTHLNYKILLKETQRVPRDCVWITQAPQV